jgi:hypothetical protein
LHGCPPRAGDVELVTVDESVLRPLFWEDGLAPRIELGGLDDRWTGRLSWDGSPAHRLTVGRGHAVIFAVDTAKPNEEAGCRVATPFGLVLLALDEGRPESWSDVVELIRAQERDLGVSWRPPVERHLGSMPAFAREAWRRALVEVGGT